MTPKTGIALLDVNPFGILRLDDEGLRLVTPAFVDPKTTPKVQAILAEAFETFYGPHFTTREAVAFLPAALGLRSEDVTLLSLTGEEPIEPPTPDKIH